MQTRRLFFSLSAIALLIGATAAQLRPNDVTLVTSQTVYYFGEVVEFTMTNSSDSTLTMTWSPPWTVYSIATGEPVAPALAYPTEVYLDPGESQTWQWDQQTQTGIQAPAGDYYVEIGFMYGIHGTGTWASVADTFEIRDQTPTQPGTWGQIKGLWR
jgi:hypothetical protein